MIRVMSVIKSFASLSGSIIYFRTNLYRPQIEVIRRYTDKMNLWHFRNEVIEREKTWGRIRKLRERESERERERSWKEPKVAYLYNAAPHLKSIHRSIPSIGPSNRSIHPSVHPSIGLSNQPIHRSIDQSIHRSIPSIGPSVDPYDDSSVRPSTRGRSIIRGSIHPGGELKLRIWKKNKLLHVWRLWTHWNWLLPFKNPPVLSAVLPRSRAASILQCRSTSSSGPGLRPSVERCILMIWTFHTIYDTATVTIYSCVIE